MRHYGSGSVTIYGEPDSNASRPATPNRKTANSNLGRVPGYTGRMSEPVFKFNLLTTFECTAWAALGVLAAIRGFASLPSYPELNNKTSVGLFLLAGAAVGAAIGSLTGKRSRFAIFGLVVVPLIVLLIICATIINSAN